MNLRRALGWFYRRLVALAEAGQVRVPWKRRLVDAEDAEDIDAWLAGEIPPALVRRREELPQKYAAAGVQVG